MIERKDLRQGNLVSLAHESNCPIVTINELRTDWVTLIEVDKFRASTYDLLMPIELNYDWLHKYGFEKNLGGYYLDIPGIGYINYDNGVVELGVGQSGTINGVNMLHIKHLHQLQNIHYWLTNKELAFKTTNTI